MRCLVFILVACFILSGCDTAMPGQAVACTGNIVPAIEVEIRDAATGAPLAAGALAIAVSGTFSDTLEVSIEDPPGTPLARAGAYERVGTYAVSIEKQGFRPWHVSGITVGRDECHVITARLEARLEQE